MEYEKICDEILNCDKHIRYVAIYDYGELFDKMRPELQVISQEKKPKFPFHRQFTGGLQGKKLHLKLVSQFLQWQNTKKSTVLLFPLMALD
jgi:hypothetical protein